MEQSILNSTKKILGLDATYDAFDLDVITYINMAFATLNDLGVGPVEGFQIEDDQAEWSDFVVDNPIDLNSVRTYVYLRSRLLFDPPQTSYLIEAFDKQVRELEWRLNVRRENTEWVDPSPTEE